MISPSNPEQDGSRGVQHDDRPDSSHEAEVRKAGEHDKTVKEEDHNEGRNAGAHQSEEDE